MPSPSLRSLARFLLLCALALLAGPYLHATTGYTVVSSAHLQDAAGNPVSNATIEFTPVNQDGTPVSFRTATGTTVAHPVSTQVYGGSFTITLADTTLTLPANICYSITLTSRVNGAVIPMPGYGCIQPSGSTWSLDTYTPWSTGLGLVEIGAAGPAGPQGIPGPACSITIGTVTALAAGATPTVVNSGTACAAVLNFGIPAGSGTTTFSLFVNGTSLGTVSGLSVNGTVISTTATTILVNGATT
jgi:hypothetical protein